MTTVAKSASARPRARSSPVLLFMCPPLFDRWPHHYSASRQHAELGLETLLLSRARFAITRTAMLIHFTFSIALLNMTSMKAGRVVLSLYALRLGAQPATIG